MTKPTVLSMMILLCLAAIALADSHEDTVASEVEEAILDGLAKSRETNMADPSAISRHGSHEFWSSGGLLNYNDPQHPIEFESFNLYAKHIQVIPLAEDVAVAMYYTEGTLQPKGYDSVATYRTRTTDVYVKEDGAWKRRAAHWSPLAGGSGTSQTVD